MGLTVVSMFAAAVSAFAFGWMYRKVRAYEAANNVSIVTPAPEPKRLPKAAASVQPGKVYDTDDEGLVYVTKEGEDIVSIAIMFGVAPSLIMEANGITSDSKIESGTILKLPESAKVDEEYYASDAVVQAAKANRDSENTFLK